MKKFIILFTIIFSGFVLGQEQQGIINKEIRHEPITSQTDAEFPGGINAFRNEFAKNFNINIISGKGQVKATANFIIERDGSLVEVKVNGNNESLNTEVKRAIEMIKTKWNPGKVNNYPVRTRQSFPITINL